ncbi:MAG: hypothetical protein R2827_06940 [Bdellovibrionales bacterium]
MRILVALILLIGPSAPLFAADKAYEPLAICENTEDEIKFKIYWGLEEEFREEGLIIAEFGRRNDADKYRNRQRPRVSFGEKQ